MSIKFSISVVCDACQKEEFISSTDSSENAKLRIGTKMYHSEATKRMSIDVNTSLKCYEHVCADCMTIFKKHEELRA